MNIILVLAFNLQTDSDQRTYHICQ